MYRKIWKEDQLSGLYVPDAVEKRIQELIYMLDFHYGTERDVDLELGGFVAAFTDCSPADHRQYDELLRQYQLNDLYFEYQETIFAEQRNGSQLLWTETLFLCGSDYAIALIRPTQTERR